MINGLLQKAVEQLQVFCYNRRLTSISREGNRRAFPLSLISKGYHGETAMPENQAADNHRGPGDPSRLRRIDEICDDFEQAWNAGRQPQIESYLAGVADPMRQELLRELRALQRQLRGRKERGMPVTLGQFTKRLVASGLMSEEEVRAFLDKLPEDRQPSDGKSLARMLVDAKILTSYQAGMVHQGKIKALVLGDYALLDRLGQGGMGMVFKARHKRMERTVALKILPPSATKTPAMVKRFAREVKAAANLEHPNIVIAHDAGEARGVHFLVMQLINGEDLAVLVRRKGPLPVGAAIDCVLQAARGLQYAHDRGIIHRDIKPNNLLVDETGTVKILDMGLARIAASPSTAGEKEELTQTGATFGTVDFMAPEQAQDSKQADERSDIYSLGCTLFYLMTARALYPGGTAVQKIFAHAQGEIPSLSQQRPEVSEELNALFAKMVAKRPEDRQQTMAEVIADLEKHGGGSQASAAAALAQSAEQGEGLDWLEAASSDREDNLQAWLKSELPETSNAKTPHIDTTGLAETVDHQPMQDTHIKEAVGASGKPTLYGGQARRSSLAVLSGASRSWHFLWSFSGPDQRQRRKSPALSHKEHSLDQQRHSRHRLERTASTKGPPPGQIRSGWQCGQSR